MYNIIPRKQGTKTATMSMSLEREQENLKASVTKVSKSAITESALSESLPPKKWKNISKSICRTKLQEQQKRHSNLLHRFHTTILNLRCKALGHLPYGGCPKNGSFSYPLQLTTTSQMRSTSESPSPAYSGSVSTLLLI